MTAANHALAGTIIALSVKQPYIALPLAFLSHFVLDTFPHFGMNIGARKKHQIIFASYLLLESLFLSCLLVFLIYSSAEIIVFACLFLAISPDFAWGYRFLYLEKFGKVKPRPMNKFNKWHTNIQKLETFIPGLFIEAAILVLFFVVFILLLP